MPFSIMRGADTIGFSHDPEDNRYKQVVPGGTTLGQQMVWCAT
jgi:hypothetical protein